MSCLFQKNFWLEKLFVDYFIFTYFRGTFAINRKIKLKTCEKMLSRKLTTARYLIPCCIKEHSSP